MVLRLPRKQLPFGLVGSNNCKVQTFGFESPAPGVILVINKENSAGDGI